MNSGFTLQCHRCGENAAGIYAAKFFGQISAFLAHHTAWNMHRYNSTFSLGVSPQKSSLRATQSADNLPQKRHWRKCLHREENFAIHDHDISAGRYMAQLSLDKDS
jgi:hypothetical protein